MLVGQWTVSKLVIISSVPLNIANWAGLPLPHGISALADLRWPPRMSHAAFACEMWRHVNNFWNGWTGCGLFDLTRIASVFVVNNPILFNLIGCIFFNKWQNHLHFIVMIIYVFYLCKFKTETELMKLSWILYLYLFDKKNNTVQIYMQFSIGHVYSCLYLIVIVQA